MFEVVSNIAGEKPYAYAKIKPHKSYNLSLEMPLKYRDSIMCLSQWETKDSNFEA